MSATLAVNVWSRFLAVPHQPWQDAIARICVEADARRARADYDTGSILASEAYALLALAEYLQARTVIEVGTFIGTSTCALAEASTVKAVYTCDVSNDCLGTHGPITTFAKQTSTQMLRALKARGVKADLCFFDGVLKPEDIALLAAVCANAPVFAVHDYNYGPKIRPWGLETMPRKGIGNVDLLKQQWPSHVVVDPVGESSTLALLVPEAWL